MTIISKIFSTLGNNNSIARIAVVDGIETAGRVTMAYKEGSKTSENFGKLDAIEKLVEANLTSLVWLGGLPLSKSLFDHYVTNKKFNFAKLKDYGKNALAQTDIRLLNSNSPQALKLDNITDNLLKPEVKKILDNKKTFKNLFVAKSVATTLGLIALVGYVLPKTIYKFTHLSVQNQKKKEILSAYKNHQLNQNLIVGRHPVFATFMGKSAKKNQLSFTGGFNKILGNVSKYFTNSKDNMVMIDAGIMAGRVGSTRNMIEAGERTLGELGYIFLLYCGGKHVSNLLEKITKKIAKVPTSLDARILQDNNIVSNMLKIAKTPQVKSVLKFTDNSEKGIINLIDSNLKNNLGKFSDITLQAANKTGLIDVVKGVRNPLKYIETQDIVSLNKKVSEFVDCLAKSANPEQFVKKAKTMKRVSILANIAICSTALAYGLPKFLFAYRKMFNKNSVAPGLNQYYETEKNNQ